jgi:hypothetical protein
LRLLQGGAWISPDSAKLAGLLQGKTVSNASNGRKSRHKFERTACKLFLGLDKLKCPLPKIFLPLPKLKYAAEKGFQSLDKLKHGGAKGQKRQAKLFWAGAAEF